MVRVDPGLTLLALRKFASLCPFKRPPMLSEQEAQGAARLQAVLNLGWTWLNYITPWLSPGFHATKPYVQNPLALAPALDDPDSECHSKIWHMMKICVWIDLMILTCYWSRWSPRKRSLLVVMAIAAIAYAAASTAGSAGIFSQARTFCCRYCRCCRWFAMATHGHIIVVKRTCRSREHGLFMDWKSRVPCPIQLPDREKFTWFPMMSAMWKDLCSQ